MKLIKVSQDLNIESIEFPKGSLRNQNLQLNELIGRGCHTYEHVMPKRLYTELKVPLRPDPKAPGRCVSMLIDEEGALDLPRLKDISPNPIASWLYETDKHGCPIMGDVLFVGEEWTSDGLDFCGIEETLRLALLHNFKSMKKLITGRR